MESNMIQNDFQNFEMNVEPKKGIFSKIFGGIGIALLMMIAYFALQAVTSIVAIFIKTFQLMSTMDMANFDPLAFQREVVNFVQKPEFLTNLTTVATLVSAFVAVVWYYSAHGRKKTEEEKDFLKTRVLNVKSIVNITAATIVTFYAALGISELINIISPSTIEKYNEMMNMTLGGNMTVAIIAIVILAPLGEECLFRGLIMKHLNKYFGIIAVIVIQAILFGVFHANIVQGLYVLPIGLLFGYVSYKTKSVLPTIYMHLLNNSMSAITSVIPAPVQAVILIMLVAYLGWIYMNSKKNI